VRSHRQITRSPHRHILLRILTGILVCASVGAHAAQPAPSFTPADVAFLQQMIPHHAQAIELAQLTDGRTTSRHVTTLAATIAETRLRELTRMQAWLTTRGQIAPEQFAHHNETPFMPGVLTPDAMKQLAARTGAEFDAGWKGSLRQHDEGVLAMIRELQSLPGTGREPEIAAIISTLAVEMRSELERLGPTSDRDD
jgi:uncharacterized protein (DUF305 family)